MNSLLTALFAVLSLGSSVFADTGPSPQPSSPVHEFSDEMEKDFNLRSIGQLQLSNLRGNVTVIGWSQDKIRVHAHRRVYVANPEQAKAAFSAMDFFYQESGMGIECSARYGRGLEINQRVQERERPVDFQSKMDMTVYAPLKLKIKIWTNAGASSLRNWNSSAELRTVSGDIDLDTVTGEKISSLCQNCSVKYHAIHGSIRAITDGGNISIADVEGPDVFVETGAGNVTAQKIRAEQLYVTRSGSLTARDLRGRVEFQTGQGAVDINGLRGFASGKSDSGSIHLRADEWEFHDKALIETGSGEVQLTLPASFAAEVDLQSLHGKVDCAFPIHHGERVTESGHLTGRIGEQTTDLLKVFSNSGDIKILRLAR